MLEKGDVKAGLHIDVPSSVGQQGWMLPTRVKVREPGKWVPLFSFLFFFFLNRDLRIFIFIQEGVQIASPQTRF